jgi:hypothetical protein
MILTAHQPVFLPWLGLFHKINIADEFCLFDIAQYQKKDYNNRNKIKTQAGEQWLSVPVESKNHFDKKICDIKIINNGWNRKQCKSIYMAYQKSPYLDLYYGPLEEILLKKQHAFLTDLNLELLKYFLSCLGIDRTITKASDYDLVGAKSDLVLDMCKKLGAKKYIFGSQGKNYADVESFQENNIEVGFQEYNHPEYNQLHGDFVPFLSVIDLLFNEGPKSKNIIINNNLLALF